MNTTPSKRRAKARPASPRKRLNISRVSDSESDSEELEEEGVDDPEKVYYCKFAIDSRRGIFYTFNWERHRKDALAKSTPPSIEAGPSSQKVHPQWEEGRQWDVEEKEEKLSTQQNQKSRHRDVSVSDTNAPDEYQDHYSSTDLDEVEDGEASESDQGAVDDGISGPHTPSKKRRRDKSSTTTPRTRKRTKTLAEATPHSKIALAKRRKRTFVPSTPKRKSLMAFPVRYPAQSLTFQDSMAHIPKNPWLRSMHALHVGSRPNALPCREEEYARVLKCVGELLEEGSGGCICRFVYFVSFHE